MPELRLSHFESMSSNIKTVLGVDVGGTKVAAGIVRFPTGELRLWRTLATRPDRGSEVVLEEVVAMVESLVSEAARAGESIDAIGLGLCELVDASGRILSANCLSWQDGEVRERLGRFAPVTIDSDVRAAAVAEATFGAGRRHKIFLYLTVGTGISCCLMIDGRPYVGARGATGTMASSAVAIPCDQCGAVNRRTLEQLASGPALVARFNRLDTNVVLTGQDVMEALKTGDPHALQVVTSAGEALGSNIGLLVNVLDPEAVILGGGLGSSEGPFWEAVVASTRRSIWSDVNRDLPILRAATGVSTGVIGAAISAWRSLGMPEVL